MEEGEIFQPPQREREREGERELEGGSILICKRCSNTLFLFILQLPHSTKNLFRLFYRMKVGGREGEGIEN